MRDSLRCRCGTRRIRSVKAVPAAVYGHCHGRENAKDQLIVCAISDKAIKVGRSGPRVELKPAQPEQIGSAQNGGPVGRWAGGSVGRWAGKFRATETQRIQNYLKQAACRVQETQHTPPRK